MSEKKPNSSLDRASIFAFPLLRRQKAPPETREGRAPESIERKQPEILRPEEVTPEQNAAAESLTSQAIHDLNADRLSSAELKLEEAIQLSPHNGIAYYWLAQVKNGQNQTDQALHLLDRAELLLEQDFGWREKINDLRIELQSGFSR